ncbi:MAG: sulfurtransferase [Leptospira sp.]|jgi:thiosulfate/3-mercaptopyruvate sulfurtransferase|nr:sulfurtransferase [Leptospira sp.]NCS94401.1 sulfurtransferase [Leptospira sp.]
MKNNFNEFYIFKFYYIIIIIIFLTSVINLSASESWFISAEESSKKILSKSIVLIDARDKKDYKDGHIPTARSLNWEELSESKQSMKGNLLPSDQLTKIFESLGISNDTDVLVYGDPLNGWGEEGRIAWSLKSIGHKNTLIIDGGILALIKIGNKLTKDIPPPSKRGLLSYPSQKFFTASTIEVKNSLKDKNFVFIDSRRSIEFIGFSPFGESRGGHLPGAKNIYFKDLIDKNGAILSKPQVDKLLRNKGINQSDTIVSYCTGGVRSSIITAVLSSYGYNAKNYAGSMWEWSSLTESEYPLIKGLE